MCVLYGAFNDSIIPGRMLDNSNGTVTDTETGLMWQQGEPGQMAWTDALIYCDNLLLVGYDDWRLPNTNELQSIVDYTINSPAGNATAFPGMMSSSYWSSTTPKNYEGLAWYMYFYDGNSGYEYKSNPYYVRAVRGGN